MLIYWPCLLAPFPVFPFSSFFGFLLSGWGFRTGRVSIALPALHCRPFFKYTMTFSQNNNYDINNLFKMDGNACGHAIYCY